MTMEGFVKVYGTVAQMITAAVAIVAVSGAYIQIETARANNKELTLRNREAAARQLFRSHLQMEFDHPRFGAAKFDDVRKDGDVEMYRYRTFLAHLLFTCEEIVETMPEDVNWRGACEGRIDDQARILCVSTTPADIATFTKPIQIMVAAAMAAAGKNGVAECQARVSG
jgi:hypothetical protein